MYSSRSVTNAEIDPQVRKITECIANDYGNAHVQDYLYVSIKSALKLTGVSEDELREAVLDPFNCVLLFFDHYAFARRGKDRSDLSWTACESLRQLVAERPFEEILAQSDGTCLWEKFEEISASRGRKSAEQVNRGIIQGFLELAQEIYQLDKVGSVSGWLQAAVDDTGRLEPVFDRMVDIRGAGPKTTSTFLRDLVFILDLEPDIENADRLFVQPVDRWLRLMAEHLIDELRNETAVDWIVAGKVSRLSRLAGVSGVLFNMGCSCFGLKEAHTPANFEIAIKKLSRSL
jgi:hypothetical protein